MDEVSAHPPIDSPEAWLQKRLELLKLEKENTRQRDRINALRRRLPMVKLQKKYEFTGHTGKRSLLDLFEGQRQLIVYHFMFDPDWEVRCEGCTGLVDDLGDISSLSNRNTSFTLISRATLEKLDGYKAKKGWKVPWYSSLGSDFNYDFHATLDESVCPIEINYRGPSELSRPAESYKGEMPGFSVFFQNNGEVFHTYSTYGRGTEGMTDLYGLLDVTPYGRQEDWEDSPPGWPQRPTYG